MSVLTLDAPGEWLDNVTRSPSPNCDARPVDCDIDLLVVHGISLPAGEFGTRHVRALFLNRLDPVAHPDFAAIAGVRVSAHLVIDRRGVITQYVPFSMRAWHAGVSTHCGREGCNDFSVGVELEGSDDVPYTGAQYESLASVARVLMQRWPAINAERIVGHSDIAPGRKTDPGPAFDWARLRGELARSVTES